ncbi:hypothetical protein SAMN05216553_118123 [Lentzea fradiae]|uniref:PLAT domain-containing protein n=1 Tax=Lentzea fradiae TaxID=200378 RepID=A0A1G8AW71_9PSEU|nr:hypothetical protein [Lentzea fradiae]SDH24610.1 hypothetical protein SAMN05216553_118123 [Lentzea fradiae]
MHKIVLGAVAAAAVMSVVPAASASEVAASDRTASAVTVRAATLPFTFTFDFETTLRSRNFSPPASGRACVTLRGTGSTDPGWRGKEILVEMWDADGIDERVGPRVRYRLDGTDKVFCWEALVQNHEHYLLLVKEWGPSRVYGEGRVWAG